jgi:hypothetical protein
MNGDVRWPGYPPSDKELRKWLTNEEDDQSSAFRRSCALLAALFLIARRWFHHEQSKHQSDIPIAERFRAAMADGMTFASHGDFRKAFFKEVIATANHVSGSAWCWSTLCEPQYLKTPSESLAASTSLDTVSTSGTSRSLFPSLSDDPSQSDNSGRTHIRLLRTLLQDMKAVSSDPMIVLVFDEAHDLTNVEADRLVAPWSRFGELRRALHQLNTQQLFCLFLSTSSSLHHSTTARSIYPSSRTQVGDSKLIEPFVELDFDVFSQPIGPDEKTLQYVETTEHLVTLGRPL